MAVRVKNAGLSVDIDFHFGDTWNSVGVQLPPAVWAGLSYSNMLTTMYNYVYHSMNVLKANGVTPTWVQIGNILAEWVPRVGYISDPGHSF